nr:tetratricopeptide repeat protein [uncultured Desulfobacter sp.]
MRRPVELVIAVNSPFADPDRLFERLKKLGQVSCIHLPGASYSTILNKAVTLTKNNILAFAHAGDDFFRAGLVFASHMRTTMGIVRVRDGRPKPSPRLLSDRFVQRLGITGIPAGFPDLSGIMVSRNGVERIFPLPFEVGRDAVALYLYAFFSNCGEIHCSKTIGVEIRDRDCKDVPGCDFVEETGTVIGTLSEQIHTYRNASQRWSQAVNTLKTMSQNFFNEQEIVCLAVSPVYGNSSRQTYFLQLLWRALDLPDRLFPNEFESGFHGFSKEGKHLGRHLSISGHLAAALRVLKWCHETDPYDAEVAAELGEVMYKIDGKDAVNVFFKTHRSNLEKTCSLRRLGRLARLSGDLETAKDYFHQCYEEERFEFDRLGDLVEVLAETGDLEQASHLLDEFAQRAPFYVQSDPFGFAKRLKIIGRHEEAIDLFLSLPEENLEARHLAAGSCAALGNYERAHQLLQNLTNTAPEETQFFISLSDVRKYMGDHVGALKALRRIAADNQADPLIGKKKKQLKEKIALEK